MDFLNFNGQASGSVAGRLLANGMNDAALRPYYNPKDGKAYISVYKGGDVLKAESYNTIQVNAATLLKDEWKQLDTAVMKVAEERLTGMNDLIAAGLTYDIRNGLGTTVLESQEMSDALEAELSMDGVHRAKGDAPEYSTSYLPLPIIHADYDINARILAASRTKGESLDTTMAERAARKVALRLEKMLFTDTKYAFGGGQIYSYVNHPDKNDITLTKSWDSSSITPKEIVDQVLAWKQTAIEEHMYGPYQIYIPTAYETLLDQDYSVSGANAQTIRERIMKISGIRGISVVDTLAANNIIFVNFRSDTVRLVRAMPMQNVEWSSEGGMTTHYKVMTIQVPQIRSDFNGACGVFHIADHPSA